MTLNPSALDRVKEAATHHEMEEALGRNAIVSKADLRALLSHIEQVEAENEQAEAAWCEIAKRYEAMALGYRKALEFYRDAWNSDCDAQLIGPGVWDGGAMTLEPSDELLADKGAVARQALSLTAGGEEDRASREPSHTHNAAPLASEQAGQGSEV